MIAKAELIAAWRTSLHFLISLTKVDASVPLVQGRNDNPFEVHACIRHPGKFAIALDYDALGTAGGTPGATKPFFPFELWGEIARQAAEPRGFPVPHTRGSDTTALR
jgi:hypothetical protein